MKPINHEGNTFYVDDIAKELSKKYDPTSYKRPHNTNAGFAVGRLLFISRMVGEFVGVNFEEYEKEYPGEQWYDRALSVFSEDVLETYAEIAADEFKDRDIDPPFLRIEKFDGKKAYFPTENLAKAMFLFTRQL